MRYYNKRHPYHILIKLNFLGSFSNNPQIRNFIKIRPVGAQLFHADGQTGMTMLIDTFQNLAKARKKRGTNIDPTYTGLIATE